MDELQYKCPVCGCCEYTNISATGSEYAALITHETGSVYLSACLGCGTLYLNRYTIKRILEHRGNRRKKKDGR